MSACFPFFLSCCALIATSSLVGVEVGVLLSDPPTVRAEMSVAHTRHYFDGPEERGGEKGWSQGSPEQLYIAFCVND